MILSRTQMIEAEKSAFAKGVQARDLMESAGRQLAEFVRQMHPRPSACRVFAGKGHNGGDVLVAARYLQQWGWKVGVEMVFPLEECQPLTQEMHALIPKSEAPDFSSGEFVVLDGVLGIGAKGEPHGRVSDAIHRICLDRKERAAWVLSADLPSGLDADTGKPSSTCVVADATMAMGFYKTALVEDSATPFVGRLALARLPELSSPAGADESLVLGSAMRSVVPPRSFDTHKGQCGRVAIVAGSTGFTGAARLCSAAAVAAGAGLVTLIVPREIFPVMASCAAPEVMVRPMDSLDDLLKESWDAIGIGPGLGRDRDQQVLTFLEKSPVPCVVDADALNAVAYGRPLILKNPPGPRLLTPHLGEMERFIPCGPLSRKAWHRAFVERYGVTLLLKGSRTLIGDRNGPPAYNSTGHPGMASGGMGDVLTGVCAALLAQGHTTLQAGQLGAWVCGRSAEIGIADGASQESLCASTVLSYLGRAFRDLRSGCF